MQRRFKVAIPAEGAGLSLYPMYPWLRQNPTELPPEVAPESLDDPTKMTSRMLRSILTRAGWAVTETLTEVRLMPARFRGSPSEQSLVAEAIADDQAEELGEDVHVEDATVAFRLEQQLQHFVADNLHVIQVNGQRVKPYEKEDGRSGLEFQTAIGRIDLLARDESDGLVIFEFKRARAADAAIGQLTRYMGCAQATFGQGHGITGVIVAPSISDELRYSAKVVPNVHLFEFEMTFLLKPACAPQPDMQSQIAT